MVFILESCSSIFLECTPIMVTTIVNIPTNIINSNVYGIPYPPYFSNTTKNEITKIKNKINPAKKITGLNLIDDINCPIIIVTYVNPERFINNLEKFFLCFGVNLILIIYNLILKCQHHYIDKICSLNKKGINYE